VLNNARLGSTSLAGYDLDQAESAFSECLRSDQLDRLNSGGRGARGDHQREMKVRKGEPFEKGHGQLLPRPWSITCGRLPRTRGACVRELALQTARFYGESKNKDDEYRKVESDFALGYLMLGKAQQRLGDDRPARKEASTASWSCRPKLKGLADERRNGESQCLLIVDFGFGPRRVTNEYDGRVCRLRPAPAGGPAVPRRA